MAAISAAMEKLENAIAQGRNSNDPAVRKQALDEADRQLADIKKHRSMCPMMSGKRAPSDAPAHPKGDDQRQQ